QLCRTTPLHTTPLCRPAVLTMTQQNTTPLHTTPHHSTLQSCSLNHDTKKHHTTHTTPLCRPAVLTMTPHHTTPLQLLLLHPSSPSLSLSLALYLSLPPSI